MTKPKKRPLPKKSKAKKAAPRTAPKAAPDPKLGAIDLSMESAGELLGISAERVRQLIKDGLVQKRGRNSVPLRSAVQGYIRFLKDDGKKTTKSAAASRLQDARAHQVEVRTAKEVRELVPAEEADAVLQTIIGMLMAALNGLPAQLTRDLDERVKIEAAIDGIRREVASAVAQFGADYSEISELDPADAEGAPGSVGENEQKVS